jgi:hypothetical protein
MASAAHDAGVPDSSEAHATRDPSAVNKPATSFKHAGLETDKTGETGDLQSNLSPDKRRKRQDGCSARVQPDGGEPVWISGPEENAVMAALKNRRLYKAPLGHGKHHIACPWGKEHSEEVAGDTVYFEPDDAWPIGGFKCPRCAGRHPGPAAVLGHRDPCRAHEIDNPCQARANSSRRGRGRA